MPIRTQLFQLLPWQGGVNTSLDSALIQKNQLVQADNVLFDTRGSRKKRPGINFNWDSNSNDTQSTIGMLDFWYEATAGASKTQRIFSIADDKTFQVLRTSDGSATALVDTGTAYSASISVCTMVALNNKVIIAVNGSGNVLKKYDPQSSVSQVSDLGGTPPKASILRTHLGRLWCNDKEKPDRLHYTTTGNPEEWNGEGDSGAIDIGIGDGDPEGITAIFPSFKGQLFIAKKTKLYRLSNNFPEIFRIEKISDSIGCVSHNSISMIDLDDAFWASERGVHSLVATNNFGDFESQYVSVDIQRTFNEDFSRSRLKFSWSAYLPSINSYALAVTDTSISSSENNVIWLYHIPTKAWYRWRTVSAQSMIEASDLDKIRFYFGTNQKRVAQSFTSSLEDTSSTGVATPIQFSVKTGKIAVDDQAYIIKAFKRFALYYKPVGTHNITVNIKIDKHDPQSLSFASIDTNDLLGSTFILGTSFLGSTYLLEPNAFPIDGYGHFIEIEITQAETDEDVEIQGFAIEYEPAGTAQETNLTSGT